MKKLYFLASSALILLAACQKRQLATPVPQTGPSSHASMYRTAPTGRSSEIRVSSAYGFLILSDTNVVRDYMNFLDSNTKADIDTFTSRIGFTSQAYVSGQASNYFAPSTNNSEYLFSQSGIVQFGNIIVRGVNDDGYFLAMKASSLNVTTFSELVSKTFDESVMCKLRIGGDYGSDLEGYVAANIGRDGSTDTPNTTPITCGRHIVRWYSAGGVTIRDDSWYFLGIRYGHTVTIYAP